MSAFEKLPPELQDNDIKFAITGGAPCSPILMSKFKNMFPNAKILVPILKFIRISSSFFQNSSWPFSPDSLNGLTNNINK